MPYCENRRIVYTLCKNGHEMCNDCFEGYITFFLTSTRQLVLTCPICGDLGLNDVFVALCRRFNIHEFFREHNPDSDVVIRLCSCPLNCEITAADLMALEFNQFDKIKCVQTTYCIETILRVLNEYNSKCKMK